MINRPGCASEVPRRAGDHSTHRGGGWRRPTHALETCLAESTLACHQWSCVGGWGAIFRYLRLGQAASPEVQFLSTKTKPKKLDFAARPVTLQTHIGILDAAKGHKADIVGQLDAFGGSWVDKCSGNPRYSYRTSWVRTRLKLYALPSSQAFKELPVASLPRRLKMAAGTASC